MKKVFVIVLALIIFIFIVKFEPFSNNPPTPIVKAGITKIATT